MVFCHVIETRDKADIDRLGVFVTSIQPAAAASDAAAKLHRLFQVLHGVAARWVELPTRYDDGGDGAQPQAAAEERDTYLNLLCMPSVAEGSTVVGQHRRGGLGHDPGGNVVQIAGGKDAEVHAGPAVMNPMLRMAHGAQLEEWFYNNQALMESFQTFSHGFEAEEE